MRRAAIAILPTLPLSAAAKAQQLATLFGSGSTAEKQGVLEVLGALKSPESRQALQGYVEQLNAGTLPAELQVDLLDAVQADGSEALAKGLETYRTAKRADTLVQAFAEALTKGGDFRTRPARASPTTRRPSARAATPSAAAAATSARS